MRYYNNRDAARHVATNAPAPTVDGQRAGKGGDGDVRGGIGGGATGGGIFAKTAKTPPLQSALRGCHCDPNVVPSPTSPCPALPPRIPRPISRVDSITTRHGKGGHATLVRAGTRVARHRPYRERNSQSRKLIEMRFPAATSQKRRIATVFGRLNCLIETSLPVRRPPRND